MLAFLAAVVLNGMMSLISVLSAILFLGNSQLDDDENQKLIINIFAIVRFSHEFINHEFTPFY